ncbi:MAG: transcriptional regulator [Syntrophobacteraceae bacterium]
MENLEQSVARYIKETLNILIKLESWEGENSLPFFLQNLYAFFEVSILHTPCLVMVPREETEQTPAAVHKHIVQVQNQWAHGVIYASRKISAYNRKRLIEQKVPFVVPGNQMYLPPLGIDLREHFKTIRNVRPKWSPSTQTVFLYALMQDSRQGLNPKELADRLGYASMSMTRAFDELEAAELGHVAMEGRQRFLRLDEDNRLLWEKALGFLRNPVRKRFWVKLFPKAHPGVEAGLTALARYSALAEPANPVFAVQNKEWREFRNLNNIMELPTVEPDACRIEIWSYSPGLFAQNGVVDRFSLYLSLKNTDDERVESALEEMMEQVQW